MSPLWHGDCLDVLRPPRPRGDEPLTRGYDGNAIASAPPTRGGAVDERQTAGHVELQPSAEKIEACREKATAALVMEL